MRSAFLTLGFVGLALSGCGGDSVAPPGPPAPPPPPPASSPAALTVHAGDQQEALPGADVAVRPAVRVTDAQGRGFAGATVTFVVDTGGGVVEGPVATTGADGVATVGKWTLGPVEGANRLSASSGSLPRVSIRATGRIPRGTLPTNDLSVTVALPAGTPVPLSALRAANTHGSVPLGPSQSFTLPFFDEGPQLAVVMTATGEPVLMGWIDPTRRAINARTTAEVLAWYDLGAYRLAGALARTAAVAKIASLTTELDPLVGAITGAWGTSPASLTLITDAVTAARLAFRRSVLSPPGPAGPMTATRVLPNAAQSGIDVADTLFQHLRVANWYRRRAVAFVDRVGYVARAGDPLTPSPQSGAALRVGSVNGLQTAAGGLFDIVTGNLAWQPVIPPPVPTPVVPATAARTDYRVIVVGPGKISPLYATLTSAQKDAQRWASLETVVLDLVLPLLSTTVKGLNALDAYFGDPQGLAKLQNFLDLLPATVVDKAIIGDVGDAAFETVKLLINHQPIQQALFDIILGVMAKQGISNPGALLQANASLIRVLTVLDILAGSTDAATVTLQIAGSRQVETWDIQVNPSKVKIPEGDVRIGLGDLQLFHVKVLDATSGGPQPTIEYEWTTTGQYGTIRPPGGQGGTRVITRNDVINYDSNLKGYGTDQIVVEAFLLSGSSRQSIGADTVTVEVMRGEILLVPQAVSLRDGEQHTFTARVEDARLIGGVLSYRWTATQRFGAFANAQNGFEGPSDQATYAARSTVDGVDQITVEVFSTQNGVRTPLGKSTAAVRVEQRKSLFFGSGSEETTTFGTGNNAAVCITYWVDIPVVPGATRYTVRGYGFNDPLFYGRRFTFTVSPPFQPFRPCGSAGWGISGSGGSGYRRMMTGLSFPAAHPPRDTNVAGRFAGLIVEVEVQY